MTSVVSKGQLISEAIFRGFKPPKKQTKFFLRVSAQASEMGQIKKIMALYYINNKCLLISIHNDMPF